MDKNLRCYIDEPISNPNLDNMYLKGIIEKYPNAIIGELEKNIMIELAKNYPNISLTYTAYQTLWFKIFGCRIYKPFSNQIKMWEWIEKEFGELWTAQYVFMKIRESRFNICWINFNQMNDKNLFNWAKMHNKEIWIYSEDTLEKFLTKISNS
jgi:uncharacterized protein with HEPN domain